MLRVGFTAVLISVAAALLAFSAGNRGWFVVVMIVLGLVLGIGGELIGELFRTRWSNARFAANIPVGICGGSLLLYAGSESLGSAIAIGVVGGLIGGFAWRPR